MRFYLAPMEGVTGHIYRNAYKKYFNDVDKYFTPFIDARVSGKFGGRESKDIAPENNEDMYCVPQILCNNAESFVNTARAVADRGYREVNINIGCPSGTVVTKRKGAGLLADKVLLDEFLAGVFDKMSGDGIAISVKTRLGMETPEEFDEVMEIYNKYPISELIIHPRVRSEYYKGSVHMDWYKKAENICKMPLVYNGDIFYKEDYNRLCEGDLHIDSVMLGRGIIRNPGLIGCINGKTLSKEVLKEFADTLYEEYRKEIPGPKNYLFKLKEVWSYMSRIFTDYEPYYKKIVKADDALSYNLAVNRLFSEQEIHE